MPCFPCSSNGLYRVWVGLVGQPQCLQIELLLQLGLSGVQRCELFPDFPATGPQTLILRVLDMANRVSFGEGQGSLHQPGSSLLAGHHVDTCHLFPSSNLDFCSIGKFMQTGFKAWPMGTFSCFGCEEVVAKLSYP